jgi:hypothetical protein
VSVEQHDPARDELKAALGRTPGCVDVSRLAGPLSDSERDHVAGCARCQTELSLLEEFDASTSTTEEAAAIQWITAEVRRRTRLSTERPPARRRGVLTAPTWRPIAIAAAAVLAVSLGYVAWDREPALPEPASTPEPYRSGQITIVRPTGDVSVPPAELSWVAVPGAERYDISVLEIDRTPLWQGTSSVPRVDLPASVTARFAPGKTVIWEVSALNPYGTAIAVSGAQRFRVTKIP